MTSRHLCDWSARVFLKRKSKIIGAIFRFKFLRFSVNGKRLMPWFFILQAYGSVDGPGTNASMITYLEFSLKASHFGVFVDFIHTSQRYSQVMSVDLCVSTLNGL